MSVPQSVLDLEMKLNWAYRHLKDFEGEVRRYLDSKPHKVGQRDDLLNGLHMRRIQSAPIDDMAAMRLSDFIFQLRSSLDHLAWQLCLIGNPAPTDKEAKAVYFPVLEKNDANSRATFEKQTKGMPDEALAIAREVQPHNNPKGFAADALWQLHRLSNVDKHRVIALGAGHSIDAFISPPGAEPQVVGFGIEFR
jgi:hypothetical protein